MKHDAKVLEFLRAETERAGGPVTASIRRIGTAVELPPGTVQQVLVRLARNGSIKRVESEGRAHAWKIAA